MRTTSESVIQKCETARCLWLHGLCMEVEKRRAAGSTVRQAIQSARRRSRVTLFRRGRLSRSRLTMLYYSWRGHRVPEVFLRNYKPNQFHVPHALAEEFLNRLVTDRVVPASAVMASLRSDWQMGKPLPGLGTWRDYWRRKHGEDALRAMPPPFPVGRSTFYAYLTTSAPADYQRRIASALRAQRELARFFGFIESRRNALAARRKHEPLGAQISPQA